MVRLAKLSPTQQASWGPHSLSASIEKQTVKAASLPEFPQIKSSPRKKAKPPSKLPALPTKEQRARQSPYISHMIKRDREHLLKKLGSVKEPVGEYKYEDILSTMLNGIAPLTGAPNLTMTALAKAQRFGNIREGKRYRGRQGLNKKPMGSSERVQDLTEYSWWRESDLENFNFPNPALGNGSESFYTQEMQPLEYQAAYEQSGLGTNNGGVSFMPPGGVEFDAQQQIDDDDDLISTHSAESGHFEDELLSSRESDEMGDIVLPGAATAAFLPPDV